MPVIVVNATALEHSGGLTILKQFVNAIPLDGFEYLVFIGSKVAIACTQSNVRLVPVDNVKSLYKRFLWDAWGIKNWLREHKIRPYASLSLQNTNFRTGYAIPNYVYYHQSIPFFPQKWSFFRKEERTLWFYKCVYPFFVRLFLNERTQVFVQLNFIKARFARRFSVEEHRIHVISPTVNVCRENSAVTKLSAHTINLFYPATLHFYKNHSVVINALRQLAGDKFALYLTCNEGAFAMQVEGVQVVCAGKLSRGQMQGMYKAADALVFPSYIETYGLPLLEAAWVGLPVLAADLPYAREVLKGYEGAVFIDYANPQAWAEKIKNLAKGKKYKPFEPAGKDSWSKLFEIINQ